MRQSHSLHLSLIFSVVLLRLQLTFSFSRTLRTLLMQASDATYRRLVGYLLEFLCYSDARSCRLNMASCTDTPVIRPRWIPFARSNPVSSLALYVYLKMGLRMRGHGSETPTSDDSHGDR